VAHLEEKGQNRPLFRFTAHLERVPGLMPDGTIIPVKTNRMAFCVVGRVMLGNFPHLLLRAGPLSPTLLTLGLLKPDAVKLAVHLRGKDARVEQLLQELALLRLRQGVVSPLDVLGSLSIAYAKA
jgi:hypothetical protein